MNKKQNKRRDQQFGGGNSDDGTAHSPEVVIDRVRAPLSSHYSFNCRRCPASPSSSSFFTTSSFQECSTGKWALIFNFAQIKVKFVQIRAPFNTTVTVGEDGYERDKGRQWSGLQPWSSKLKMNGMRLTEWTEWIKSAAVVDNASAGSASVFTLFIKNCLTTTELWDSSSLRLEAGALAKSIFQCGFPAPLLCYSWAIKVRAEKRRYVVWLAQTAASGVHNKKSRPGILHYFSLVRFVSHCLFAFHGGWGAHCANGFTLSCGIQSHLFSCVQLCYTAITQQQQHKNCLTKMLTWMNKFFNSIYNLLKNGSTQATGHCRVEWSGWYFFNKRILSRKRFSIARRQFWKALEELPSML